MQEAGNPPSVYHFLKAKLKNKPSKASSLAQLSEPQIVWGNKGLKLTEKWVEREFTVFKIKDGYVR